ncbi:MAG: hypothetical protein A4E19_12880 [Nitrospira sp. SG-bin1]|nr:MAG: hypothetical protein A4E19_12880 [Nitrospira sp. SG-bin1]
MNFSGKPQLLDCIKSCPLVLFWNTDIDQDKLHASWKMYTAFQNRIESFAFVKIPCSYPPHTMNSDHPKVFYCETLLVECFGWNRELITTYKITRTHCMRIVAKANQYIVALLLSSWCFIVKHFMRARQLSFSEMKTITLIRESTRVVSRSPIEMFSSQQNGDQGGYRVL